jgi:hypothetical protein
MRVFMTTAPIGLPEAARHFDVSIRLLRDAIRAGRLPALPQLNATVSIQASWLAEADAAVAASPKIFSRAAAQKVPAFARFEGTSFFHKFRRRARAYAAHRAAARAAG